MTKIEVPDVTFVAKSADRTQSAVLQIRCSDDWKREIKQRADALNLNVADYIRLSCDLQIVFTDQIANTTRPPDVVLVDKTTYLKLTTQIRRIGNNINQMSRALNTLALFAKQLNKKQAKYPEFLAAINKIKESYPSFLDEFRGLRTEVQKLQKTKTYELSKLPNPSDKRG